jgi:hypothetical protein
MKVDRVETCVCCDHEPTVADSCFYGMPQLKISPSYTGKYWFVVYCPNCGRGGLIEYKSAYLALKHWNEMQKRLKKFMRGMDGDEDAAN